MDPQRIKKDFPILAEKINGNPLIFLDSAASSQKPTSVIQAIDRFYRQENANIHRGIYYLSQKATELYEKGRIKVSEFIGARCGKVIIFTRNTTESINLVAQTWGRANISRGDEIVVNEMEHHSNLVPWQMLAQEKHAKLRFLPLKEDYSLDYSQLDEIITPKTKLVAISQMSNVTGTIHDLQAIHDRVRQVGAKWLVDGAQGVCHMPVDVQKQDIDFYAFSGHKMLGPTGIGVLYGKEEILETMPPWMGGGDMIYEVEKHRSSYADLPARLEAGTPNIAGVIGLYHAIDYLQQIGMAEIIAHERQLTQYALAELENFAGITVYGPTDLQKRGGVISFNMEGIHPHDVGSILDEQGIAIRVGHHCCQPFMSYCQISGTARMSFYLYNSLEDIDALVNGLKKVQEIFGRAIHR